MGWFKVQPQCPMNCFLFARFTPLHEASNFGCLEYVEELHKAKANLNMKSKDGVTPLITAAANGHLDILEYLLNAGAKTCIQVCSTYRLYLKYDFLTTLSSRMTITGPQRITWRSF